MHSSLINSHANIALQFSGGRDSIATLLAMRPWWDRITVYHLDTGSSFPEIRDIVSDFKEVLPNFVTVHSPFRAGLVSDLVPVSHTRFALETTGDSGPLIESRYDCCWRRLMWPLHQRMLSDNVTLIIRGERKTDKKRAGLTNLQWHEGIQYLFPIEDWDDSTVSECLRVNDVQLPPFYSMMSTAPDCMDCTAWWDENRAAYMKQHHPAAYTQYQQKLQTIEKAITFHLKHLQHEME